jgi:alpha-L-rhamnosidase
MTSACGQIKGTHKNATGQPESVGGPGAPPVAWQGDTYIHGGRGEELYTPRFTFHAFRYVEMSGYPGKPPSDAITGLRLNSDVGRIGSFACSNERFNRIQAMCDWTFLSNIFSVQSDCPHRERFGYGGDIAATSEAFLMNYDMAAFYAKAVRDWGDSALDDGMLTDTAPFVGIQYCGPAWAMAHPLLQRQLHRYCGNRRLVEEQYEVAKRWLELVAGKNPEFVVQKGLSDHEALVSAPAPVMVTPLYAAAARTVGELAGILGRGDDATRFAKLAGDIRAAYLGKFLDPATGRIGPGTQASQAIPLYWDVLPAERRPAALQVLLDDIRGPRQGHLSTGIFGTKYALDVLSREGHADLACAIVNQPDFPGWGHMLERGATTLWEHWKENDNTFSQNHPMFGSVSQWFFQWLGGIQPAPDAVGFDRVIIRPQPAGDLSWVNASYDSVRGKIVSRWRREKGVLTLQVEIPPGVRAAVFVPVSNAASVAEGGKPAAQSEGVRLLREERSAAVFEVGSGHYAFTAEGAPAPKTDEK